MYHACAQETRQHLRSWHGLVLLGYCSVSLSLLYDIVNMSLAYFGSSLGAKSFPSPLPPSKLHDNLVDAKDDEDDVVSSVIRMFEQP